MTTLTRTRSSEKGFPVFVRNHPLIASRSWPTWGFGSSLAPVQVQ